MSKLKNRSVKHVFTILLIFLAAFVLTTEAFPGSRKSPRVYTPTIETPPITPIKPGISYSPVFNYTQEEKEVLFVAERLVNEMFQSSCFENFMLQRALRETNGKTNQEVVTFLKNFNVQIPLHMYENYYVNTVGYRNTGKPDIFTNRKYHAGATACSRATNLGHETSHVAGWGHAKKPSKLRPLTVPYSITASFEACCVCEKVRNSKGKMVTLIKECSIR